MPRLFAWAVAPYYANADDQAMMNDVVTSAILRNMTFLEGIARCAARVHTGPRDGTSRRRSMPHRH